MYAGVARPVGFALIVPSVIVVVDVHSVIIVTIAGLVTIVAIADFAIIVVTVRTVSIVTVWLDKRAGVITGHPVTND